LSQRRIGNLENLGTVCTELAKVYRDIYRDRVRGSKATLLLSALDKLRKCHADIADETLRRADEDRILAIERKLEGR